MNWKDITLGQYQDIYKLHLDSKLDEMERIERLISIVYGLTENEVNLLPLQKFNEYARECSFLLTENEIPGKPKRYIKVNGKKYRIIYYPSDLQYRQYVEVLTFAEKPIENMHLIMASIVKPIKYGFITKSNDVAKHSEYAADMEKANFIDIYHTCVFFCKLYKNLMEAMQGYLVQEMTKKGMEKWKAEMLCSNLVKSLDGFIPQPKSQNIKERNLKKSGV